MPPATPATHSGALASFPEPANASLTCESTKPSPAPEASSNEASGMICAAPQELAPPQAPIATTMPAAKLPPGPLMGSVSMRPAPVPDSVGPSCPVGSPLLAARPAPTLRLGPNDWRADTGPAVQASDVQYPSVSPGYVAVPPPTRAERIEHDSSLLKYLMANSTYSIRRGFTDNPVELSQALEDGAIVDGLAFSTAREPLPVFRAGQPAVEPWTAQPRAESPQPVRVEVLETVVAPPGGKVVEAILEDPPPVAEPIAKPVLKAVEVLEQRPNVEPLAKSASAAAPVGEEVSSSGPMMCVAEAAPVSTSTEHRYKSGLFYPERREPNDLLSIPDEPFLAQIAAVNNDVTIDLEPASMMTDTAKVETLSVEELSARLRNGPSGSIDAEAFNELSRRAQHAIDVDDEAIVALENLVCDLGVSLELGQEAVRALVQMHTDAGDHVISGFLNGNGHPWESRTNVVDDLNRQAVIRATFDALVARGDGQAIGYIANVALDANVAPDWMRTNAIEALGRARNKAAVEHLRVLLLEGPMPPDRELALNLLVKHAQAAGLPADPASVCISIINVVQAKGNAFSLEYIAKMATVQEIPSSARSYAIEILSRAGSKPVGHGKMTAADRLRMLVIEGATPADRELALKLVVERDRAAGLAVDGESVRNSIIDKALADGDDVWLELIAKAAWDKQLSSSTRKRAIEVLGRSGNKLLGYGEKTAASAIGELAMNKEHHTLTVEEQRLALDFAIKQDPFPVHVIGDVVMNAHDESLKEVAIIAAGEYLKTHRDQALFSSLYQWVTNETSRALPALSPSPRLQDLARSMLQNLEAYKRPQP